MAAVAATCITEGAAAQTADKPTLSDNTRINIDNSESRWHGTPTVVVDPNNPKHLIITERHQLGDGTTDCEVHTSYDAMATFKHAVLPSPTPCSLYGNGARGRVDVAFGSNSRAYFLVGSTNKTSFIPSTDGGLTFGGPVDVDTTPGDFNRMAVRMTPGAPDTIYVIRRGTSLVNPAQRVVTVSVSTNNGDTWSPRTEISDIDKFLSTNDRINVAAGPEPGRVYVTFTDARPTPPGAPPTFVPFAGRMFMIRSDDNGATWSPNTMIDTGIDRPPSAEPPFTGVPASPAPMQNYWPSLAVDQKSGTVFLVWSDERSGDARVYLKRSTDGGATWGPLQTISPDDAAAGHSQYRGSISIAPNGRIDIAYYDAVNTCPPPVIPPPATPVYLPCYDANVFLRSSSDGGSTFGAAQKLSAQPFDFRLKRLTWAQPDVLDVNTSVASASELAYTVWQDTRLGTPENNNRDIAGARAQFSPFVRLLPPPEFVVVAVVETITPPPVKAPAQVVQPPPPPLAAAAPPPPPPVPPPATPVPPAAPIVPASPAPLLQASSQATSVGVGVVAPSPDLQEVPAPMARWQEATAGGSGNGQLFFFAGASIMSLLALALSFAALTRLTPKTETVPARQQNS